MLAQQITFFPEKMAQPEEKVVPYQTPTGYAHQIQDFSLRENVSIQ